MWGGSKIFLKNNGQKIFFIWRKLYTKTSKKLQGQETKKTTLRHNIFKLYKIIYKHKNLKSNQIKQDKLLQSNKDENWNKFKMKIV